MIRLFLESRLWGDGPLGLANQNMKTFLMNTWRRGLKRGTSRDWLFLALLSAVAQIIAQPIATTANPTNNASLYGHSAGVFRTDALDGDGTATNLEFYPDFPRVGAVSNSPYQLSPTFNWLATQVGTEAEAKPAASYSPGLELRALKPDSVQSGEYLGVEQSGILVQAARSNPLQLINPFAPAIYGDGEANILRNLVTREVEGLKLWQISF